MSHGGRSGGKCRQHQQGNGHGPKNRTTFPSIHARPVSVGREELEGPLCLMGRQLAIPHRTPIDRFRYGQKIHPKTATTDRGTGPGTNNQPTRAALAKREPNQSQPRDPRSRVRQWGRGSPPTLAFQRVRISDPFPPAPNPWRCRRCPIESVRTRGRGQAQAARRPSKSAPPRETCNQSAQQTA